jgi:integrase
MILLAFWHGLRASEVCAMQRDAIASGFVTVQRLKGSKKTTQPLVKHADPLLDEPSALFEYLAGERFNQRLFPIGRRQFWKLFQRYSDQAGIPEHKRHPHVLKHTVITLSLNAGAKIHEVQRHAGHASMGSTGRYAAVTDEQASEAVIKALR